VTSEDASHKAQTRAPSTFGAFTFAIQRYNEMLQLLSWVGPP